MSPEKMIGLSLRLRRKLYEVFAELNARFQSEAGIHFVLRVLFCTRDAQLPAAARAEAGLHRLPVGGKDIARHERLHAPGKAAAVYAPRAHPVKQRRRAGDPPREPVIPTGTLDVSQQLLR